MGLPDNEENFNNNIFGGVITIVTSDGCEYLLIYGYSGSKHPFENSWAYILIINLFA